MNKLIKKKANKQMIKTLQKQMGKLITKRNVQANKETN